jgi:hypothetical protein
MLFNLCIFFFRLIFVFICFLLLLDINVQPFNT